MGRARRGEITAFDAATGEGLVVDEDGVSRQFGLADLASPATLLAGLTVKFFDDGSGHARELYVAKARRVVDEECDGLDLGRVIKRTVVTVQNDWQIFLGVAVVLIFIPEIVSTWANFDRRHDEGAIATAAYWIATSVYFAGHGMSRGMLLKVALNGFKGQPTRLNATIAAGLQLTVPLLALGLVVFLGTLAGLFLLVVPGLILFVWWAVSGPVLVERPRRFSVFVKEPGPVEGSPVGYSWTNRSLLFLRRRRSSPRRPACANGGCEHA